MIHPTRLLSCSLVIVLGAALSSPLAAQTARRLWDKDVDKLMAEVIDGASKFAGGIDRQYRTAVLRSPTGEVKIDVFLKDFQNSCKTMRQRFKANYSASSEVEACLRQVSGLLQRQQRGDSMFGADEALRRYLEPGAKGLAAAYGADIAADPGSWTVRRMNDKELGDKIKALSAAAKSLKGSARKALSSADKQVRSGILAEADHLTKATSDLQKQFGKKANVTAILRETQESATRLGGMLTEQNVPANTSGWGAVAAPLAQITAAFGMAG